MENKINTFTGIVEKIVNGGWGLVRSPDGVVFLNYVLPGETVVYSIRDRAKGILWGQVHEVVTPAPERIQPPCPYFGTCGGCVFQHVPYPLQLEIKREIVMGDLERIGKLEKRDIPIVGSQPYHYRMRAKLKSDPDTKGFLGFVKKGTHQIMPIEECLLLPDPLNRFLDRWNSQVSPPVFFQVDALWNHTEERIIANVTPAPDEETLMALRQFPDVRFTWKGEETQGVSRIDVGDFEYRVSPGAFFQVNRFQWLPMLELVEDFCVECDTAIDLYSGVGFFLPLLLKYAKRVIGVESSKLASKLAAFSFSRVRLFAIPVETFHFPKGDLLLCDPPRAGLSKLVMKRILERKYRRLVYISCNSATFSRDLNILRQNGYELMDLRLLDLFPQTPHIEMVSLFVHR